jgi:hypothetical protein
MELVVRLDVVKEFVLIELTVRVDPVREVKYPVVVDRFGTWIDDRTVSEEVTCAS